MAHANVYIRKENETKWEYLNDKSAWVNKKLSGDPDTYLLSPKLAKQNPEITEVFDKLAIKAIGRSNKFCKEGHPIPDGDSRCLGKGCKYS